MKQSRTNGAAQKAVARLAKRERIADAMAPKSWVEVTCTATTGVRTKGGRKGQEESRTDGKNIVIWRTHNKQRGNRLQSTTKERKQWNSELTRERQAAVQASPGAILRYLSAIGVRMRDAAKRKVRENNLIDSSQLLRSITYRTKVGR